VLSSVEELFFVVPGSKNIMNRKIEATFSEKNVFVGKDCEEK